MGCRHHCDESPTQPVHGEPAQRPYPILQRQVRDRKALHGRLRRLGDQAVAAAGAITSRGVTAFYTLVTLNRLI